MDKADEPKKKRATPIRTRGGPEAVDVHVGSRVRQRRTMLGMSQEKLGEALGLTFQQVQKYERGANRVGAGRLYELSHALDVPVNYFFEELPDAPEGAASGPAMQEAAQRQYDADPMAQRETLLLVRAYYDINDPAVRRRVLDLIRAMGRSSEAEDE